jgi:hypothetical protein
MASPLGLSFTQRYNARRRVKRAAMLSYYNRARIHYTQGASRWQGIARRLRAGNGQYPSYADCSSIGSWFHWDATRLPNLRDYVNGESWAAGYTGTMTRHGVRVSGRWLLVGDAVFYGGTSSVPGHVAWVVKGGPLSRALVASHGSEAGPVLIKANYRTVNQCRRFIR